MGDQDNQMTDFSAAQRRMWELVERYTDRVGYRRGTKAAGLDASPPVIDCSGWVGVLLTAGMSAQDSATGKDIFDVADIGACVAWSDRIVLEIESRTPTLLVGCEITAATLIRNHRAQSWDLWLGDKLPSHARHQSYRSSGASPG